METPLIAHALDPEPFPGYNAQLAALEAKKAAAAKANAVPLPGPLRQAFAAEPLKVCGYTFQPVTAALEVILTRINSPILPIFALVIECQGKPAEEVSRRIKEEIKPDPEALIETVFAFTRPCRELRALLDQSRAAYRDAAMDAVGDKVTPYEQSKLFESACRHYADCFATAISYEASQQPSTDGTVFTKPAAPPTTASDAGSTRSVA